MISETDFNGIILSKRNAILKLLVEKEYRKKIVIDNLEIPRLRYGQVLIKMLYSSICQTQVGEILGKRGRDPYLPHCLGHEAVGKVVDKHNSVKKVNMDDKVCLSWIKGRGIESGGTQYKSLNGKIINAGPVNTFSEYAVVSENRLYKLLNKAGISCAPNNAPIYIKKIVDIVTEKNGGDGAFREFIEILIGEDRISKLLEELT